VLFRQNYRCYDLRGGGAPDQWLTEQGQGEHKVMIFTVIYGGGLVFGPYPILNRPYNSVEYVRMLEEDVLPEIQAVLGPRKWRRCIFQQVGFLSFLSSYTQDGATIHTSNLAINFLHEVFGDRVMSGRRIGAGGYDWAPNSPDLSPCDFWFHGFLKANLYKPMPPTIPELLRRAENIYDQLNNDERPMIRRAVFSMRRRARECMAQGGGHFEGKNRA